MLEVFVCLFVLNKPQLYTQYLDDQKLPQRLEQQNKANHCGQWLLWLTTPFPSSSPSTPTPKPHTLHPSPQDNILHCTCNAHATLYSSILTHRLPEGSRRVETLIMNVAFTNKEPRTRPESAFSATSSRGFVRNVPPVSQYLVFLTSMWGDHRIFLSVDEAEECLDIHRKLWGFGLRCSGCRTELLSSCVLPVPSSASAWISFLYPFFIRSLQV